MWRTRERGGASGLKTASNINEMGVNISNAEFEARFIISFIFEARFAFARNDVGYCIFGAGIEWKYEK